jgi:nucleotide-binding universal stress UspA family protein
VAQDKQSDLIIMGGYGRRAVAEVTLGSVVEEILQTCQHPTLICQ